ncbi:MAG TPA: NADH-quinone oxidoreductase subunit C [Flavobacteriales bacterium]
MPSFAQHTERDQRIIDRLRTALDNDLLAHERFHDVVRLDVKAARIIEVLGILKNEFDFNFLTSLCGMHHPGEAMELAVVYHLHSMRNGHRLRVKTWLPMAHPEIPTATGLWPTANWMERETWDFYGIRFTGHPNLKRILNMEDFPAFPMRKDYPLEDPTRHDKNDSMFGR